MDDTKKTFTHMTIVNSNDHIIQYTEEKNICVVVQGFPSSGYLWKVTSLPSGIVQVYPENHDEENLKLPELIGSKQNFYYYFETQNLVSEPIILHYKRPWESEALRSVTVHMNV